MKTFTLFIGIFLAYGLFAQLPQYQASDFNLKGKIASVSEKAYSYDPSIGKYKLEWKLESTYENNLLVRKVGTNYMFFTVDINDTLLYENNQLIKVFDLNQPEPANQIVSYDSKGQMMKVEKPNQNPSLIEIKYNNSGLIESILSYYSDTLVSKTEFKYSHKSNYTKTITSFDQNNITGTIVDTYVNNLMVRKEEKNETETFLTIFEYNHNGHNIKETNSDGSLSEHAYQYDNRQNIMASKQHILGIDGFMEATNYFTFYAIQYTDGNTTGSTDLDSIFVKLYEPFSYSYTVVEESSETELFDYSAALEMLLNSIPASFEVLKVDESSFKSKIGEDFYITDAIISLTSTNNLDMLMYYPDQKEYGLAKNFFSPEFELEKWSSVEKISCTNGKLWILSEKDGIFLIDEGKVMDMSQTTLLADPENENSFYVQINGVSQYILKDLNFKSFDTFYELSPVQ